MFVEDLDLYFWCMPKTLIFILWCTSKTLIFNLDACQGPWCMTRFTAKSLISTLDAHRRPWSLILNWTEVLELSTEIWSSARGWVDKRDRLTVTNLSLRTLWPFLEQYIFWWRKIVFFGFWISVWGRQRFVKDWPPPGRAPNFCTKFKNLSSVQC